MTVAVLTCVEMASAERENMSAVDRENKWMREQVLVWGKIKPRGGIQKRECRQ